jgi:hypothetical protein
MDFRASNHNHIAEIGQILAVGLSRQIARQSSRKSAEGAEISLDISSAKSGHPDRFEAETGA